MSYYDLQPKLISYFLPKITILSKISIFYLRNASYLLPKVTNLSKMSIFYLRMFSLLPINLRIKIIGVITLLSFEI